MDSLVMQSMQIKKKYPLPLLNHIKHKKKLLTAHKLNLLNNSCKII
jgi:hypothetical protein